MINRSEEDSYSFWWSILDAAAYSGNLNLVETIISRGVEIQAFTVRMAVHSGNLEMVKYLLRSSGTLGIELTTYCYLFAAYKGQMHIIKYISTIFDVDMDQILFAAYRGGRVEVIEYAIQNGGTFRDKEVGDKLRWAKRIEITIQIVDKYSHLISENHVNIALKIATKVCNIAVFNMLIYRFPTAKIKWDDILTEAVAADCMEIARIAITHPCKDSTYKWAVFIAEAGQARRMMDLLKSKINN
jgi:hypothetical protein